MAGALGRRRRRRSRREGRFSHRRTARSPILPRRCPLRGLTRTAAPVARPGRGVTRWRGAPASRRATPLGGAHRSGAWRVSFLRGASRPHEAGARRVGGGWFRAGDFTFNVSKPISPRARRPTHRAHRADRGFGCGTSVRNSVRSGRTGRCGRACTSAVGKPPLRYGSSEISGRARPAGALVDDPGRGV